MKLYRTMLQDSTDSLPVVGNDARMLGVRIPPHQRPDIQPDPAGDVRPQSGGMSVVADDPLDMKPWLLPQGTRFRGTSRKGIVYEIEEDIVHPPLALRPDGPPHHVVEPAAQMPLPVFEAGLTATRRHWKVY